MKHLNSSNSGIEGLERVPEVLFTHHSDEERFHFDKSLPLEMRIPRRLGRACLLSLRGESSNARRQVSSARRELRSYKKSACVMEGRFMVEIMASHYGDYINHARNIESLARTREDQYDLEMSRLTHALKAIDYAPNRDRRGRWAGFINELTVMSVMNRQMLPTQAAFPALSHHENGEESADNHDVLLVMPNRYREDTVVHKTQVKSSRENAERARLEQSDDVYVVCAEDVLGYKKRGQSTAEMFPIAHLLVKEHQGLADNQAAGVLDGVAGAIVDEVSGQFGRYEQLRVAS